MSSQKVGRFHLHEVIGVGSFATVYRAHDGALDDTVVIKILAENHSLNPEVRQRFITEGRSLRRIDSPHVLSVHDIGESERQQPYLVLDYADRGTLAARLAHLREQGWAPDVHDVLHLARSLAAAVGAVHKAGLVHRDLSPGNILLTGVDTGVAPGEDQASSPVIAADERLVLADLGLCKDLALNSGLTVAAGTNGFRPPEQHGTGMVDTRADLWAMSALMLWVCGDTHTVPHGALRVLGKSMATNPAKRHSSVQTWLADLETALATPKPPKSPKPTSSPAEPAQSATAARPRGRRLVAMLAAGLLVIGIAFGAGYLASAAGGPPTQHEGASVQISGPSSVAVGDSATFTVETVEVTSVVWVLPTGRYLTDVHEVTLTPRAAGRAQVVVLATAADGTEMRDVFQFTATD